MPIKILMPALSPTMLHGNLIKWVKKENDNIKPGDIIAEIETDKATMEIEAVDEGILGKILIEAGTKNVEVNSVIAILLEEGESSEDIVPMLKEISNLSPLSSVPPTDMKPISKQNNPLTPSLPLEIQTNSLDETLADNRIFISPLARRIAKDEGIDLANIQGSGPRGRIIKSDLEQIITKRSSNSSTNNNLNAIGRNSKEFELVPNSNIRKIIAKRLQESKQTIPHFYLSFDCNVDKLLDIREDINLRFELKEEKISVNDFIVLAAAKALKDIKHINASWEEDSIKYYNNIDISIAVATDGGLVTPIVRNADHKNIVTISNEIKELAIRARANKLRLDEFQGGGFSISNLGMYGIKNFTAIINPPQSCILAVGAALKKPIVVNDQVIIATIMEFTLSCDHRVVDGAIGAQFISVFKRLIEHPAIMLV